ncbi:hypothetical protein RA13_01995 [Bacillus atrophaeus]|nr:hypothetical protein RA13_01995 [Bacillus atrophaeus]
MKPIDLIIITLKRKGIRAEKTKNRTPHTLKSPKKKW